MGKRKEDEQGPSLGERVHMWLSSAKILYTLLVALGLGTAYGNSETVRNTVNRAIGVGDIPVAPGEVVTPDEGDAFEAQVRQSLASIVAKLEEHSNQLEQLRALSGRYDSRLQEQINELKAWHE